MRFWEATGEQSPVEAFIEQIYSEYPVSPFNPRQHAVLTGEGENQTIALFELEPSKSVRGAVELHWIQAYPQRQGVGTAAIRELQAKAREAGIKMSLYPKPNGSVSQASLKRLYKRLGFNPIHKGAATMVWDPAVSEQVSSKFSDYEIAIMEGGNSLNQVVVYHGNQGGISRGFITPMWWTESYDDAKYYATVNDLDGWVYKAMLSCGNPYVLGAGEDANTALMKWQELAKQGYDCIHDSQTGDWIPFFAKDIQLIDKQSVDPELTEASDFDNCFAAACKLYKKAKAQNKDDVMLFQVAGYKGNPKQADPRWRKIPASHWHHYVVLIDGTIYDPTAKQFGPDSETKYPPEYLDQYWDKLYEIPEHAIMEGGQSLNTQKLTELADRPYAFEYAQHGAMQSAFGFQTDQGAEYTVIIFPMKSGSGFQNNLLDVSFALLQDGEAIDTQTGEAGSDALRIFGTVLEAVKATLAKRTKQGLNIEYIRFAAKNLEPKRVALYQRMAKNIGRYLPGWKYESSDSTGNRTVFLVKRTSS